MRSLKLLEIILGRQACQADWVKQASGEAVGGGREHFKEEEEIWG